MRVLGAGGFADVFLFEQNMPRRQVAVKVMLPEVVNEQVRRMFRVEADLMATLSAHPSILTVYEAGVSADGRPYLVMELCSASLGQRYRSEPLPVAEVLRIGVKIAGALHTAHERGILHRDVKPSNILLTAYGTPVLSDFGISSTTRGSAVAEAVGLSIPWSAPEVVGEQTQGTVASEVWSLSATLYSLLAGRSPFEQAGASAPGELAKRIMKGKLPPIGRADVPGSLEAVLARGLSKNPAARPATALELLRELQAVETELGLTQTGAEIAMAEWASGFGRDTDERTILHTGGTGGGSNGGGTSGARGTGEHGTGGTGGSSTTGDRVRLGGAGGRARRRRAPASAGRTDGSGPGRGPGSGSGAMPDAGHGHSRTPTTGGTARTSATMTRRGDTALGYDPSPHRGGSRHRRAWIIGASALLLVVLTGGGILLGRQLSTPDIPQVGEITAEVGAGRILFSWADPGLQEGDSYRVTTAGQSGTGQNGSGQNSSGQNGSQSGLQSGTGQSSVQRGREFAVYPTDGGSVCISVAVVRSGRVGEASTEKCAAPS
ncbi:serine/threonine-protein kinase [Herbiconiux solani]|uniref:serine/threonine-protein kinase n=1 Tax=Herbiconiux solani TaxID=661329 RepID=UPI001FDEDA04|nr:serine/threonine-protein kinase [Herbiconiux solani]